METVLVFLAVMTLVILALFWIMIDLIRTEHPMHPSDDRIPSRRAKK